MNIRVLNEIGQMDLVELFELSFDPICILGRDGQLLTTNQAFDKLIGISHQNISNLSIYEFIHSDDQNLIITTLNTVNSKSTTQSLAVRLVSTATNYKWFLFKIHPAQNQLIYIVAKDITPFQQLESLEHARSQFAEALLDTVLAVNNSNLALENVLQRILTNVVKVVLFTHVNILLIKETTAFIAAMQNSGEVMALGESISNLTFSLDKYHYLKLMIKTKQPVIIHDIVADSNWTEVPNIDFGGSFLGCPVIVDGEVLAFINVINVQTNFYTSIHARQLLMFANHVAIAIKNAYLYEQAEDMATLKERQRLARELHDSVNQILFSAGTYAKLIPQVLENKPEKVTEYANKIRQHIWGALAQMRTILIELRPDSLINTDLNILLKQLCNAFTGNTGISVEMHFPSNILVHHRAQIAYYRVAQEALHNIEKHANATEVRVSLTDDDGEIRLVVEDNGCGFILKETSHAHFGLQNIHERAEAIDADLQVKSQIGKGTRISLEWKSHDRV